MKYECSDCGAAGLYDQKILEWWFYEWQRKNPDNLDVLREHIADESVDLSYIVHRG